MTNIFDDPVLAAGYAAARPPLHPLILQRIRASLPAGFAPANALDIGCGAGLSTAPLLRFCRRVTGIDPSAQMVRVAQEAVSSAKFEVAGAEKLPVEDASIDLITAAGSLNYADLPVFYAEAWRVLRPGGFVAVYDFAPGRISDSWFEQFSERFPWPPFNGNPLSPQKLEATFPLHSQEDFTIALQMTEAAFLAYMLTETNVRHAVEKGTPRREIEAWCAETLRPLFQKTARDVVFKGYYATFQINSCW